MGYKQFQPTLATEFTNNGIRMQLLKMCNAIEKNGKHPYVFIHSCSEQSGFSILHF